MGLAVEVCSCGSTIGVVAGGADFLCHSVIEGAAAAGFSAEWARGVKEVLDGGLGAGCDSGSVTGAGVAGGGSGGTGVGIGVGCAIREVACPNFVTAFISFWNGCFGVADFSVTVSFING